MLKNYIYYLGGSYGDLTETIINNGIATHKTIKLLLKNDYDFLKNEQKDDYKKLILNLKMNTICGHIKTPLYWNLKNFAIIITDEVVIKKTINRFCGLYGEERVNEVLKFYYPEKISHRISELSLEKKMFLLHKKYNTFKNDNLPNNITFMDFNFIFEKEKYISLLKNYFIFDTEIAYLIYDRWFLEQQEVLSQTFY
jgi:hypothetical protein